MGQSPCGVGWPRSGRVTCQRVDLRRLLDPPNHVGQLDGRVCGNARVVRQDGASLPASARQSKGLARVNILSYNPGHDGAVAQLNDGHLVSSIEAEKDSNYRYTPLASHDLLDAFGRLEQVPDVVCTGGWWPREARSTGSPSHVGYRGIDLGDLTSSAGLACRRFHKDRPATH